ncbi:MAG: hypothetical protein WC812_01800 [Candidatus Pacearchaeota archaeon]|jgi:hypothetical protein
MDKEYIFRFNKAKDHIKRLTGLELSLIELVELKKYVIQCIELSKLECNDEDVNIHPALEAGIIFLNKNYGTDIRSTTEILNYLYKKEKLEISLGFDYYSEFFKREQEQRHLP